VAGRRLTIATDDYDRIQALKQGKVAIEGFALDYLTLEPGETFTRLFRKHEFDISEMSFSTYMVALSQGGFPYRAIPVFLSRVFPHGSIYVRAGSGIREPRDLKGRLVGAPSYHFTRGLVVRGMLQDEYGIRPGDLRWRIGGVDKPEDFSYVAKPSPSGVEVEFIAPDRHLAGELAAGRIDAIISYRDPEMLLAGDPRIARLFEDFRAAEQDWYRRTRMFPAMHLVGIRESLLREYPELAINACRAFEQAKSACMPRLYDLDSLKVTLPWLVAETRATAALMGADFWPYGVAKNANMIETQARWSFEQGLSSEAFKPSDLFASATLQWVP
jgi:4,5-dihydroxyphthalate decarboxylase